MSIELVVYSRTGCHLCEDMEQQLAELKDELGFTLKVIDIQGNKDLEEKFGIKVPVLMAEEQEICHYMLDLASLKAHLQQLKQ
jgi:glutaredoxin